MIPTRDEARDLLCAYNQSPSLLKHARAVEGVMRYFAAKYGEDVEYWGAVGLLHDLDYERYPDEHCDKAGEIMRERGLDPAFIRAVQSHGYGIRNDVEPLHVMEKALYATDELTGLITAACAMRPSRSVLDLELPSLKKKYKDKKFAAGVSRELIERGAAMLGLSPDELLCETILAMRSCADAIDLRGNVTA